MVSHSEGSHLAEPKTINESVQIVRAALGHYTQLARDPELHQLTRGPHIQSEVDAAVTEAEAMIAHMEAHIQALHTPEGLYRVLFDGYIPVPHLWGARQEFGSATDWATRVRHGRVDLVDQHGSRIDMAHRLALIEQRRAAHS